MKIQLRILIVLAAVFFLSLLVMSAVLLSVVAPAFDKLDQNQAEKNAKRVEQSLANELTNLRQTGADWGNWNDTYAFARDRSPAYIAANLQPSSLINLGITVMGYYDDRGRPIWVGGYDPETEESIAFPGLSDMAQMAPVLVAARAAPLDGLLAMDGRYFLISADDILDSDGNGPPHGTLLVGREIDQSLIEELSDRTKVVFRARPHAPEPASSVAVPDAPREITRTDDLLVHRLVLNDVRGVAGLDLEIETPRDANIVGRTSVDIAIVLLIATALLTTLAIAAAIHVLIVRPIRQINQAMRDVGESADLDKRLGWTRPDEFGILARQFDDMLEQIAVARRDLLELTFKIGRSDLATGIFHNMRNALSPLANQLHRAIANLAPTDTSHAQRALSELQDNALLPDRRARLLEFLGLAWSQSQSQRQAATREIDAASGQLAAVEQILNRQDENHDVGMSLEALPVRFLVNESLQFFGAAQLATANIDIDNSLDTLPSVAVQRMPMIHVFYNIFANAVTAIEAHAGTPGHVVVRAANDPQRKVVRIEIRDNGIGVPVTSLDDIFRPGYTTKPDKKGGEGLHWCANALATCGGRIWANSTGIGDGMSIFIEVPQPGETPPAGGASYAT